MIRRLFVYESPGFDPYRNLAVEEYLLNWVQDSAVLYLWQNRSTVVIGRNQNPWKECKTTLLEQEGGHLARRLSGGGAVFHDLGNLNFTLVLPKEDYDLPRQMGLLCQALGRLGIPAQCSGRNDLQVEGRKVSGNAFFRGAQQAYHHGTLLICADVERMGRYLSPSKLKLQAKGVDSVRSRVANLREFQPGLTVEAVKRALTEAFSQTYGLAPKPLPEPEETALAALTGKYASWEWNYGPWLPFNCTLERRFPWGGVTAELLVEGGRVSRARISTDAMEVDWPPLVERGLLRCRFDRQSLTQALPESPIREDLAQLFSEI